MILVINTSNLKKGGGIQVALSFIQECIYFYENEYHVFISPNISSQIEQKDYPENFHFYPILNTPASILHGIKAIHQLKKLEKEIKPDCIFTVFGPSYWTPKSPHLLGFAKGKFLYTGTPFFKKTGVLSKARFYLTRKAHRFFFKKNSDFFYVESEDSKQRLSSFLNVSRNKISAISNTYNPVFNQPLYEDNLLPPKTKNEFRLVTISSYYKHKNLEIIKDVIPLLQQIKKTHFTFILTIEQSLFEKIFKGFERNLINLGPIPIRWCPKVYHESDALFLPTLVEIFTASYPEAMKMNKPILTSDLPFAHEICGEAAEFFDPLNPEDVASKIINLSNNPERQRLLIRKGEEQLLQFETSESRARKLLEICKTISNK